MREIAVNSVALAFCTTSAGVGILTSVTFRGDRRTSERPEGIVIKIDILHCIIQDVSADDRHPSAGHHVTELINCKQADTCGAGIRVTD